VSKFGIIGAGNGGQSIAGDLVLRNIEVAGIYDCNPTPIQYIKQQGGIKMTGPVVSGFASISLATTNIEELMEISDILLVAVPATAHETLAKQMAPHLRSNHLIVLFPGYVGGTIVFRKVFEKFHNNEQVLLAETISMPYATRLIEPAAVGIKARKRALPIAAFPGINTTKVVEKLNNAFPEIVPWEDVLSVGFNNPNPILHVVKYLFNLGRVESPEAFEADFHAWGSPTIDRIEQKVDSERLMVIQSIGLKCLSIREFHELCYGELHYKPIPISKDYKSSLPPSASQAPERFITEDVPMGLVPISDFGKKFGVPTPTADLLIDIASFIRETDYRKLGRTCEYLGLADMNTNEIKSFLIRGY
jgi:opine dehydrogenase